MTETTTAPETYAPAAEAKPNALSRSLELTRSSLAGASFTAPLLTRIVLGMAFFQAGLGKWGNLAGTTDFFAGLGIPFPGANAAFIALLEMIGGLLLIPGIASRLWAGLLSATMVVALATAHPGEFATAWAWSSDSAPTDITAFTFLLFLSWLLFFGPGAASLDHLVARLRRPGKARH